MKIKHLSDWETHLVLRAQAGERVAFEILADEHRAAMRGLALRMLRNAEDASDAVQEALVKAFRALSGFHVGKPVLPWLLRITTNCCIDIVRHRKPTEQIDKFEYTLQDPNGDVFSQTERNAIGADVHAAIQKLPSQYREIVMMRHYRDMEVGEIAQELNKPEGTVKSWLFRARLLLKKELAVDSQHAVGRLAMTS